MMTAAQPLRVTGDVESLGAPNVVIHRSGILGLFLALDAPRFEMQVHPGNNDMIDDAITPSPIIVDFDPTKPQVSQVLQCGEFVGYTADSRVKDAPSFPPFNQKIAAGTLPEFDTAYVLVPGDEKAAFIGKKGLEVREARIDGQPIVAMRFEQDGIYALTTRAAYYLAWSDVESWLDQRSRKLKGAKVLEFDTVVTTLSRRAGDNTYYVSGTEQSHKIQWTGGQATIIDTAPARKKVLGLLAGNEHWLVLGTPGESADGPIVNLGFQQRTQSQLGY